MVAGFRNQKQTMRIASYNRGIRSNVCELPWRVCRTSRLLVGDTRLPREQASCGRHPWLWFDEHLWLACRICGARLRWHALVLSGIVSRRVERGTRVRECDELCAITTQTRARNKTQ